MCNRITVDVFSVQSPEESPIDLWFGSGVNRLYGWSSSSEIFIVTTPNDDIRISFRLPAPTTDFLSMGNCPKTGNNYHCLKFLANLSTTVNL